MKTLFLVVTIFLVSFGFASSAWDGLRIRADRDPTKGFFAQPRTVAEATAQGFQPVGNGECNASPHYNGRAYVKSSDYSVTLLYDKNGFIAGIQAGIPVPPASSNQTYPSVNARPPLVLDGITNTRYVITAYFTEPSLICSMGRHQCEFNRDGTGEGLWLQTGQYPSNVTFIPMSQSEAQAPLVAGKCYHGMGMHYWYDISETMNCDDVIPIFLLYNRGRLNAFGWAFPLYLDSPNYEHPPAPVFPYFFDVVPTCLNGLNGISTLHIYLTNDPSQNNC